MSSNATFDSRINQVSEGVLERQNKDVKQKKSKCSKSSGSISKSVVCSSCDEEVSDQDAERKGLSTASEASSTNVIFFKDITDSSANSVEDRKRVLLKPGKRKNICSKLKLNKKVKMFKGVEGMDESIENFCDFHKQIRLKPPEKQYTKRRPISPEQPKYQKPYNTLKHAECNTQLIRTKKPSPARTVAEVPSNKYTGSIFKVFMKPQETMVKKRLVPVEVVNRSTKMVRTPSRTSSRNLIVGANLEKKRSPLSITRPASTSRSVEKVLIAKRREDLSEVKSEMDISNVNVPEEVGDYGVNNQEEIIKENIQNLEVLTVQKSKSTLKTNDRLKPVSSKRSVHWEDEVLQVRRREQSSDESVKTESTETWEMECARRTRRIRRTYEKFRKEPLSKTGTPKGILPLVRTPSRENLKEQHTRVSRKPKDFSPRNSTVNAPFQSKYEEVVQRIEVEPRNINETPLKQQAKGNENKKEEKTRKRLIRQKHISSSESEIHRRRNNKYYSETSDEEDECEDKRNLAFASDRMKGSTRLKRYSDNEVTMSSTEENIPSASSEGTLTRPIRRPRRGSEDDLIIHRRTSSPALCKSKDSISRLVRRRSSPVMDRKCGLDRSRSSLSTSSPRSNLSTKDTDWLGRGETNHPNENSCQYEQAKLKQNIENLSKRTKQLNFMLSTEKICKAIDSVTDEVKSRKLTSSSPAKTYDDSENEDPLSCFKECLKETEECLEKLKCDLSPETKDRSETIKKIRAKLSKIRHQVDKKRADKNDANNEHSPTIHNASKRETKSSPRKAWNVNSPGKSQSQSAVDKKISSGAKAESSPNDSKPENTIKPSPRGSSNKVGPTDRSKKILESWRSTEKSIGERSEKLLQTIRTLREKKAALKRSQNTSDKPELETESNNSDNVNKSSEKNECKLFQLVNTEDTGVQRDIVVHRSETEPESNNNKAQEIVTQERITIEENEKEKCSKETDELHNNDSMKAVLVVNELPNDSECKGSQDIIVNSSETAPSEGKLEIRVTEVENEASAVSSPEDKNRNAEDLDFKASSNENLEKESSKTGFEQDLKENNSFFESMKLSERHESESSSPSLENVTNVSMESMRSDRLSTATENFGASAAHSTKSSRPPSRFRDASLPRSRLTSAGSSVRSAPERPPSRKPYFNQESSEEEEVDSDETSLSQVRIHSHQPRSRNCPGSLRTPNMSRTPEATVKKPPPSRMYSTLKETPFAKQESIKSAIRDLNFSPKPSLKKVTMSTPASTKSTPRTSQHKLSSEEAKYPPRPSTARGDVKPPSAPTPSRMSHGSLRILKQKVKSTRDNVQTLNPEAKAVHPVEKTVEDNRKEGELSARQAFLKKRISSFPRKTVPESQNNVPSRENKNLKRPSVSSAPKPGGVPPAKCNEVKKKKSEQLRVTFEKDLPKSSSEKPAERKLREYQRQPLSQRLPNYRPPWERVDLRPPERALAERASHEKKLFGGPRTPRSRSRPNSDASRPQTPMNRTPDPRTPNKGTNNPASSGTPTKTLTVNTNNDPRHESESDCSDAPSHPNSSSYDTAPSSVEESNPLPSDKEEQLGTTGLNTNDPRSMVTASAENDDGPKYPSSQDLYNRYNVTPLRKSSSVNTVYSSDGLTHKTNSTQTIGEEDCLQSRCIKSLKVSVETGISKTDLFCIS